MARHPLAGTLRRTADVRCPRRVKFAISAGRMLCGKATDGTRHQSLQGVNRPLYAASRSLQFGPLAEVLVQFIQAQSTRFSSTFPFLSIYIHASDFAQDLEPLHAWRSVALHSQPPGNEPSDYEFELCSYVAHRQCFLTRRCAPGPSVDPVFFSSCLGGRILRNKQGGEYPF